MNTKQSTTEKPKYFDLDIHGSSYLNRVRDVTPENGTPFLSVTIAALRGPADNVQHTYFDCVVVWRGSKGSGAPIDACSRSRHESVGGVSLSDLQAEAFTFKQGERAGTTGIGLKSRLLRFQWIKVDGQPFPAPVARDATA